MRDWEIEREEQLKTARCAAACAGWLVLLYLILSIVSMVDEHYTRRMNALRQPVPVRTDG